MMRLHFQSLPCGLMMCLSIIVLTSCSSDPTQGYSHSSIYSDEVRTVAVPIFENETFVRDIEFELTDALIKEIEARTPYKVSTQGRSDTVLVGIIRAVELDQLSKSPATGLSEELAVRVTIDYRWLDMRTDRTLVARESFQGNGLFLPSPPSGERLELGQMAVVQQLARDIVGTMQAAW